MFNKVQFLTRHCRGNNQQYYYSLHLRQIIVKYFYRVLIVFKYPFLHFPSRSIDYHVQFSTVIYNFGYRRRIANRSGELRHEEFSHCYIVYMKALAEKNLGELRLTIFPTITLKLLAKGGEQIENVKETAKNCLKK